ncbi:MAG: ABC transporter permease [Bacillota bacterium]
MTALKTILRNPVLMREARVRMRGWRAPGLIALYVGLLGAIAVFIFAVFVATEGPSAFAPQLGSIIYTVLAVVQLALLVLAAPGLTAGAISGERERQTLDLLLVTRMSPFQVVVGKLLAAVGFALLLMFASLPIYGILFLFGGFSLYRLALTALIYLVTVLLLGSVGLYFSAVFKRTQAAVVTSYGLALGTIAVTPILAAFIYEVFQREFRWDPPVWGLILAWVNPLFGLAAAAGEPLSEMTQLFRSVLTTEAAREGIWWQYCLTALAIMALLIWRTTVRINPLRMSRKG